jgi:hypothetical protein
MADCQSDKAACTLSQRYQLEDPLVPTLRFASRIQLKCAPIDASSVGDEKREIAVVSWAEQIGLTFAIQHASQRQHGCASALCIYEDVFMEVSMLPNLLNEVDAATSGPSCPSIGSTPTPEVNACLIARIGWCHRQAMEARTTLEVEEWYSEQKGLIDALLERDCTPEYQGTPALQERYRRGCKMEEC